MKKIVTICLCFCLLGCSSKAYKRDTKEGQREFITIRQMEEKIVAKDDFVIIFGHSQCTSCAELNTMLKEYLLDHTISIYEVILNFEETTVEENRKVIDTYFTGFSITPSIYYVENGKQVDQLETSDSLTEEEFDEWVVKHRLDEKKQRWYL